MCHNSYDLIARAVDHGARQCSRCLDLMQDDLLGPDGEGEGRDYGEEMCEECRRKGMRCSAGR